MKPLVIMSDFGQADGAVSAMYGVAYSVCESAQAFPSLTHEIPQYNAWEASYRLIQTVGYWPKRHRVRFRGRSGRGLHAPQHRGRNRGAGQYIITPDNGTLTHVKRISGIVAAREIDERNQPPARFGRELHVPRAGYLRLHRRAPCRRHHRLFAGVGPEVDRRASVVELPMDGTRAGRKIASRGDIDVLDVRFGSLWTSIPRELFLKLGVRHGDFASRF